MLILNFFFIHVPSGRNREYMREKFRKNNKKSIFFCLRSKSKSWRLKSISHIFHTLEKRKARKNIFEESYNLCFTLNLLNFSNLFFRSTHVFFLFALLTWIGFGCFRVEAAKIIEKEFECYEKRREIGAHMIFHGRLIASINILTFSSFSILLTFVPLMDFYVQYYTHHKQQLMYNIQRKKLKHKKKKVSNAKKIAENKLWLYAGFLLRCSYYCCCWIFPFSLFFTIQQTTKHRVRSF
jgi:hypothetical protein